MARVAIDAVEIARRYVQLASSKIKINKAILFGSTSRSNGRMNFDSDIDIIIISKDFEKMAFLKRLEFLSLLRGREFISVPMDILGYTPKEFANLSRKSSVLAEAKEQGKIIWTKRQ